MHRLIVLIIIFAFLPSLRGAELPDPWADLRPAHAVRSLVALRAPLDAAPDDQRLLGLAIGAYVALCLNGHPELDGAWGPWLGHARELVARRRVARAGAACATLAEAAPELWVRLIDGDAVGVVAELERLPAEPQSAQGLALRALATLDWRPLAGDGVRGALVDYARMALFHRTMASRIGVEVDDLRLVDPYVVRRSLWRQRIDKEHAGALPGEAVAGIALLLQGRQIDDATATAQLRELFAALGAPAAAVGREQLLAQLPRAARAMKPDNAKALAVAERIALAHAAGARGVRGADGRHLLVGLGDVSLWVRSRLFDAAYFAYVAVWYRFPGYPNEKKFAERDLAYGAVLRAELPGSLLAAHVATGLTLAGFANLDEPSPPAAADELARALTVERARPQPLPDQQLAWVAAKLAKRRADLAQPILAGLLAGWPRVDGAHARTGLGELLRGAWRCEVDADLLAMMRVAAARMPADGTLHFNAGVLDPAVPLLDWTGATPTATWIEPTVDARRGQFPRVPYADHDFAIRWEGWLHVAALGRHRFKVVTNDYFKVVIGELVLADPHQSVLHDDLAARAQALGPEWAAGWLPLTIDFEHRGNAPEFRLLWQPPGADGFTPIPAERLAHGPRHEPGLTARALEARRQPSAFEQLTGEPPATFVWVAGMPWRTDLQINLGTAATTHRQYVQLLPLLRAARAINPALGNAHLINCLLLSTGKDIDEGLALMKANANGFWRGDLPEQRLLVSHLRDQGRLADFAAIHDAQSDPRGRSYLRLLTGLARGRFAEIQPRMDEIFGDISNWTVRTDLRATCLLTIAVHRMCSKSPPDFGRVRELVGMPTDQAYRVALACLDGVSDPQAVVALAPWDRDLVRWAEALLELAEGDHAKARPIFAALAAAPTGDPGIAELSRDLLAWYATQTPATLAATPKAPPLKRRAAVPAKTGVDDF